MPWAWDDRICGVSPYNRYRLLSLLFRDYCTPSGSGRFKLPNVEAGLQNRMSGACEQTLLTNDRHELSCALDANEPQPVGGSGPRLEIINFKYCRARTSEHRQDYFKNDHKSANRHFRSAIMPRNFTHWRDFGKPSLLLRDSRCPGFSKTLCSKSPPNPAKQAEDGDQRKLRGTSSLTATLSRSIIAQHDANTLPTAYPNLPHSFQPPISLRPVTAIAR